MGSPRESIFRVETFVRDLVHSLRLFRRGPGFTVAAVAALTLGIGTNIAIFTVVNAVLLKPNQAGTLSETLAARDAALQAGFGTIISARSGETEDVAIVHLAVGWNAGQLKVGSFARGERTAKWNEGLRIEEVSGARYAGAAALRRAWSR